MSTSKLSCLAEPNSPPLRNLVLLPWQLSSYFGTLSKILVKTLRYSYGRNDSSAIAVAWHCAQWRRQGEIHHSQNQEECRHESKSSWIASSAQQLKFRTYMNVNCKGGKLIFFLSSISLVSRNEQKKNDGVKKKLDSFYQRHDNKTAFKTLEYFLSWFEII